MAQLEIISILRDEIDVEHFQNSRTVYDADTQKELQADIERDGLTTPVTVWNAAGEDEEDHYVLIAGFRRMKAVQALVDEVDGMDEAYASINCTLFVGTFEDALALNIKENTQRDDLPTMDAAEAVNRLYGHCNDQTMVAAALNKSQPWVSVHLSFARSLCNRAKEALGSSRITLEQAKVLTRMVVGKDKAPDQAKQEEYLSKLLDGKKPREPGEKVRSIVNKTDMQQLRTMLYRPEIIESMDPEHRASVLTAIQWFFKEVDDDAVLIQQPIPAAPVVEEDGEPKKRGRKARSDEEVAAAKEAKLAEKAAAKEAKAAEKAAAKQAEIDAKAQAKQAIADAKAAAAATKKAAAAEATKTVASGKKLPPAKAPAEPKAPKATKAKA